MFLIEGQQNATWTNKTYKPNSGFAPSFQILKRMNIEVRQLFFHNGSHFRLEEGAWRDEDVKQRAKFDLLI